MIFLGGGGLTAKKNKMGVKNVTFPISPTLVSLGRNSVTLPKIEGELGQIHWATNPDKCARNRQDFLCLESDDALTMQDIIPYHSDPISIWTISWLIVIP